MMIISSLMLYSNMFVAEYLKMHDVGQFPNAWKELSKAQQKVSLY